jgi:hypothetical protein
VRAWTFAGIAKESEMIIRLLLAGFLLAHALIHVGFVSPKPAPMEGGPSWPFDLARSWILSPFGVDAGVLRIIGIALVAVTLATSAAGALFALGFVPASWAPFAVAGATASLALLLLFFHPWLILGVLVDVAILWAVLVARWDTLDVAT